MVLQMVNWFLAGKDIGQPRTRFFVWWCVSIHIRKSSNIEVQKGNCQHFCLLHPDLHLHQGKMPLIFLGSVRVAVSAVFTGLTTWIMWEQIYSSQSAWGFGDVSQRITHTGHHRSCVTCIRSDHLGKCKDWGQKRAPSFWKLPQTKEIIIGLKTVFIHILRRYKYNSVSSNVNKRSRAHFLYVTINC